MPSLTLSSDYASALPILAALLGAAAGAFLTNLVRSWYDYRAKIREGRERIVGDAATVTSDALAALVLVYGTRNDTNSIDRFRADADALKALGKINQLNLQVWHFFPEWYATMTFQQMARRFKKALDYLDTSAISDREFKSLLAWYQELQGICASELGKAAKLNMHRPSRFIFHGFTRKEHDRRKQILMRDSDDPAPWECFVKCRFTDSELSPAEIDSIERKQRERLDGMKCREHERAPHVCLVGRSNNFAVEVTACCADFQARIMDTLTT